MKEIEMKENEELIEVVGGDGDDDPNSGLGSLIIQGPAIPLSLGGGSR